MRLRRVGLRSRGSAERAPGGRPAFVLVSPIVLGVAALALGIWGYERLPGFSGRDALYAALRLFVLEYESVTGPEPWQLEVARLLAPAVAAFAVIEALLALFARQLRALRVRLLARDHVVVAGLGGYGADLAHAFAENGDQVVAVEPDPSAPAVGGCRARGIVVLEGEPGDALLLAQARISAAKVAVAGGEDDGTNLDVALATSAAVSEQRRPPLVALVHVGNVQLWSELEAARAAARERHPGVRVVFFDVADAGARLLLERHPPFPRGRDGAAWPPHVLVAGLDGVAERLVLHAARLWRASRADDHERFGVTVAAEGAERRLAALVDRHPELETLCRLRARDVPAGGLTASAPRLVEPDSPFSAAYVCVEREGEGLATALTLHRATRRRQVPIVLVVDEEGSGPAGVIREWGEGAGLHAFGVRSQTLRPGLLLRGTNEVLARAMHDHYLESQRAAGVTQAVNPSLIPWSELPVSLQESSRRFAERIGSKLDASGCVLAPSPLADPSAVAFSFTAEEVEGLARMEHDGWCADLVRDGWRPTEGAKDPERRLHPRLVPWSELPEDEREKDRAPVRELPRMVARAGFELVRVRA